MFLHGRTRRLLAATIAFSAAAGGLPVISSAAAAEEWPARPVKLIVPYSAGGPTDAIARQLATRMESSLGQPVVVEN